VIILLIILHDFKVVGIWLHNGCFNTHFIHLSYVVAKNCRETEIKPYLRLLLQWVYGIMKLACENIRFSSLFAAGDVSPGGTSATQRQKFHTDDANQCLHNESGSHGVPNINLSNFACLLVDFREVLCSSGQRAPAKLKCFF